MPVLLCLGEAHNEPPQVTRRGGQVLGPYEDQEEGLGAGEEESEGPRDEGGIAQENNERHDDTEDESFVGVDDIQHLGGDGRWSVVVDGEVRD